MKQQCTTKKESMSVEGGDAVRAVCVCVCVCVCVLYCGSDQKGYLSISGCECMFISSGKALSYTLNCNCSMYCTDLALKRNTKFKVRSLEFKSS